MQWMYCICSGCLFSSEATNKCCCGLTFSSNRDDRSALLPSLVLYFSAKDGSVAWELMSEMSVQLTDIRKNFYGARSFWLFRRLISCCTNFGPSEFQRITVFRSTMTLTLFSLRCFSVSAFFAFGFSDALFTERSFGCVLLRIRETSVVGYSKTELSTTGL